MVLVLVLRSARYVHSILPSLLFFSLGMGWMHRDTRRCDICIIGRCDESERAQHRRKQTS